MWKLVGMVIALVAAQAELVSARSETGSQFPVPASLRTQVDFWKDVFAKYSRDQVVLHDTERLDRIYTVLDFRTLTADGEDSEYVRRLMQETARVEEERIATLFRRLHQVGDGGDLTAEEQRIAQLFANDPNAHKFLDAAMPDRIRAQTGLRERFARGIEVGHRYFREMEAIFDAENVPLELTRLPLVESCFDVRAYSKVGAAGIWQFMPSTGRRFMRVDGVVDERRDPIRATRAAARFLRENYYFLGTWPLAITAYNHGPAGVARAVRETGTTDVTAIIARYRGPAFKFASRNFYPEFLAALEVERDHHEHFGPLNLEPPMATDTVLLTHPIGIFTAATYADTDRGSLADLNPSLAPRVEEGRQPIPAGFALRIPLGASPGFERRYERYASSAEAKRLRAAAPRKASGRKATVHARRSGSTGKHVVHRVQKGQTLAAIARRYGSSVDQIRRHNGLRNSSQIRTGQVLRIPRS